MLDSIVITIIKLLIIIFNIIVRPFIKHNKVTTCVIMGYCGLNNTGAECRINEIIKQLNQEFQNQISITVLTENKTLTNRYIKESSNVFIKECKPHQIFKTSKIVSQSDIFILAEGCTFKDNFTPVLIWVFFFTCALAQSLGKKTIAYAVDAGKMSKPHQKFAKEIANNLDLLTVRTTKSANILNSLGVTNNIKITADTAFLTETKDKTWLNNILKEKGFNTNKPLIGIAFKEFFCWPVVPNFIKFITNNKTDLFRSGCYYTFSNEDRIKSASYHKLLASYADWCAEEFDANIAIIAMEEMDNRPCEALINHMNHKPLFICSADYNAEEIATLLTNLKFLVTTRYHAIILSMQKAVPFIGLSSDERIEEIMKELNLYTDFFINYDEKKLLENLKDKTLNLNNKLSYISNIITEAFPNYVKRMNENTTLFKQLINK